MKARTIETFVGCWRADLISACSRPHCTRLAQLQACKPCSDGAAAELGIIQQSAVTRVHCRWSGWTTGSRLRCDFCQFRNGIHIARSADSGCWNRELRAAHAAPIVNENLFLTEAHLLISLADRMIKGIAWRTVIEEDRIRELALQPWEGIGLE